MFLDVWWWSRLNSYLSRRFIGLSLTDATSARWDSIDCKRICVCVCVCDVSILHAVARFICVRQESKHPRFVRRLSLYLEMYFIKIRFGRTVVIQFRLFQPTRPNLADTTWLEILSAFNQQTFSRATYAVLFVYEINSIRCPVSVRVSKGRSAVPRPRPSSQPSLVRDGGNPKMPSIGLSSSSLKRHPQTPSRITYPSRYPIIPFQLTLDVSIHVATTLQTYRRSWTGDEKDPDRRDTSRYYIAARDAQQN